MPLPTFKGGAHPPDYKSLTEAAPVKVVWPKAGTELLYPVSQHTGKPCTPIVEKDETVRMGQKIAVSDAFVSAPIHSGVSGVVKEVRDTLTPSGVIMQAIVIEYDGESTDMIPVTETRDYKQMTKQDMLDIIRDAGLVGLGGAGFPMHVKLNPPPEKIIDTILINAAECEPYLTSDYRAILEESSELIEGIEMLLHMHEGAKAIIGIEANKPQAIKFLKAKCAGKPFIKIRPLAAKYPQGAEKQLIYACLKRQVPFGSLPADMGCIVQNVNTVIAMRNAVLNGAPLIHRVVTIAGGTVKNPGNYKVPIGMTFQNLIDLTGGLTRRPKKLVAGGPMMGIAMFSLDIPITKTISAMLCLTEEEAILPEERVCIRCARCSTHCPVRLLPQELNQNVQMGDMALFRKNHGIVCIECGTCSFVCPGKLQLAQRIRAGKRDVLNPKPELKPPTGGRTTHA